MLFIQPTFELAVFVGISSTGEYLIRAAHFLGAIKVFRSLSPSLNVFLVSCVSFHRRSSAVLEPLRQGFTAPIDRAFLALWMFGAGSLLLLSGIAWKTVFVGCVKRALLTWAIVFKNEWRETAENDCYDTAGATHQDRGGDAFKIRIGVLRGRCDFEVCWCTTVS